MNLNGAEYYYVRNAQGDIIGLINAQGEKVVSYTYDSWGKLISIEVSLKDTVGEKNPYRYRGYRYDSETGLYYLQNRYYNPEWGRFINADGIIGETGELLSHNIFAYCNNNFANFNDPSGYLRCALDYEGGGGGGGAIAIPLVSGGLKDCLKGLGYGAIGTIKAIGVAVASGGAYLLGRSKVKEKAVPLSITNKNNSRTKLYRAMDYVEYNRFIKSGRFSSNASDKPWVMDTKWFATNIINANRWGHELNPYGYKVVEITIPSQALSGMYYTPYLDAIGPAYNGTVPYMNAVMLRYRTVN